jgi:hypothetical protein
MPELRNFSPFPNFRYYSSDATGRNFGVVIVKATYEIDDAGQLVIAEEQAPMMFTDACHGAVNISSLWHPSDLVPNKPRTDVIVNAVAYAPDGVASPNWTCGVQVEQDGVTILDQKLCVTGPRHWLPVWKRPLKDDERRDWRAHRKDFECWTLSQPEPVLQVPLHYELAYGGTVAKGLDSEGQPVFDDDPRNPIGRGRIDREWTDHTQPQSAPQIELANELIADPYANYIPQGLGPIPCSWEPRLPLAGTYDQNWIDNIWPNWAPDYDFAYHNSAHPNLIAPTYLQGDEEVTLVGLCAGQNVAALKLPGHRMIVELVRPEGTIDAKSMKLDTVFLDIASENVTDWRVFLSWRINFTPDSYVMAGIRFQYGHDSSTQEPAA